MSAPAVPPQPPRTSALFAIRDIDEADDLEAVRSCAHLFDLTQLFRSSGRRTFGYLRSSPHRLQVSVKYAQCCSVRCSENIALMTDGRAAKVSDSNDKHAELTCALLYGILTDAAKAPKVRRSSVSFLRSTRPFCAYISYTAALMVPVCSFCATKASSCGTPSPTSCRSSRASSRRSIQRPSKASEHRSVSKHASAAPLLAPLSTFEMKWDAIA